MAIAVATLIDRAKALADRRTDASIPDTDWGTYVNYGVEDLYRFIVAMDPSLYFASSDFTLTGGPAGATIDLTTLTISGGQKAFRALHGLDLSPDTTNRRTIPRRNFRERNVGRIGWWIPTQFAVDRRYDLRQTSLVITPYEFAAGTYRVYYRQAPYNFVSTVDGVFLDAQLEQWSEWIAVFAARYGLGIEESFEATQNLTSRLGELATSITESCRRDDEPSSIADIENDGSWDAWGWP